MLHFLRFIRAIVSNGFRNVANFASHHRVTVVSEFAVSAQSLHAVRFYEKDGEDSKQQMSHFSHCSPLAVPWASDSFLPLLNIENIIILHWHDGAWFKTSQGLHCCVVISVTMLLGTPAPRTSVNNPSGELLRFCKSLDQNQVKPQRINFKLIGLTLMTKLKSHLLPRGR